MINTEFEKLLINTAHCFRLGQDGEGNQKIALIMDHYIALLQNEETKFSKKIIEKIEEIQIEMDCRNYIRIADILEFEMKKIN